LAILINLLTALLFHCSPNPFIAVRVLGLRQGGISEETQNDSCEKILAPTEWKLLWVKLEGKQLPAQTPTLKWACLKLAKLGLWHDSKRTSRPGWVVMWDGWFRHQDMAEGYLVMKSLDQEICSRDRSKMGGQRLVLYNSTGLTLLTPMEYIREQKFQYVVDAYRGLTAFPY